MWLARRAWLLAVMLTVLLTGCDGRPQDVTHNPAFGDFDAVVGTWRSKVPLRLTRSGATLYLVCSDTIVRSPEELLSLPEGTELKIERLVYQKTFETSTLKVVGSLMAGPYSGKPLELDDHLFPGDLVFRANIYHGTEKVRREVWGVASDKLGRAP